MLEQQELHQLSSPYHLIFFLKKIFLLIKKTFLSAFHVFWSHSPPRILLLLPGPLLPIFLFRDLCLFFLLSTEFNCTAHVRMGAESPTGVWTHQGPPPKTFSILYCVCVCVLVHICNASTGEAEAGGLRVQGQFRQWDSGSKLKLKVAKARLSPR